MKTLLLNIENIYIYTTLEQVRNSLIELSSKSGVKSIFDGIKLVLGSVDKKFLDSFNYEEKIFFTFTKKVFIPITLEFYDTNNNFSTLNDIIIFNKKLEKESNDFKKYK